MLVPRWRLGPGVAQGGPRDASCDFGPGGPEVAQSGPGVQCWFHDERVPERLRAAILAGYGRFARFWLKMGLIRDDLGHLGHFGPPGPPVNPCTGVWTLPHWPRGDLFEPETV